MGEMPLIGGGNSGGSLKDPTGRQDEPGNGRVHLPLRGLPLLSTLAGLDQRSGGVRHKFLLGGESEAVDKTGEQSSIVVGYEFLTAILCFVFLPEGLGPQPRKETKAKDKQPSGLGCLARRHHIPSQMAPRDGIPT